MAYIYKKRAMTLLEIMIVIFLIGLIASVIGYNMKGSLDEGRAFKTRQAKEQLRDILLLEYASNSQNVTLEEIAKNPEQFLAASGMVKNPKELLKDGWGNLFSIKVSGTDLTITSETLKKHNAKKQKTRGAPSENDREADEEEY